MDYFFSIIAALLWWTKYLDQSKEIIVGTGKNGTAAESFDICFCLIVDRYCQNCYSLFTIIMNNLILYQKFLNKRRRTIYIFAVVCVFQFCSIAFYLVSIILFENFIIHFHLKGIIDMLEYCIIG